MEATHTSEPHKVRSVAAAAAGIVAFTLSACSAAKSLNLIAPSSTSLSCGGILLVKSEILMCSSSIISWLRHSRSVASTDFMIDTRKIRRKYPSPFLDHRYVSSSTSIVNDVCNYWNRPLSLRFSSQPQILMPPCINVAVRTLSSNTTSETNTAKTTKPPSFFEKIYNEIRAIAKDPSSFFQNAYNEICAIAKFFQFFISVDLPILVPRIIGFGGSLHLISEYGFNTIGCEGPSMEPTIIDGSDSRVLIDRFSHRLFGLEKDDTHSKTMKKVDSTTKVQNDQNSSPGQRNEPEFSWFTLMRGVWEQHFTSGLQRGDVIILQHPLKVSTICKRIIGMPGDTILRTDGGDGESRHRRVVPPGHLWIEGDNTLNSTDSRSYGTVPASLVIGKVVCRLWPLREYVSLGVDANGMEHWGRVSARIGRGERPLTGADQKVQINGSHVI